MSTIVKDVPILYEVGPERDIGVKPKISRSENHMGKKPLLVVAAQ